MQVASARRHFQFRANVEFDFRRVVVNEMPKAVMRDPPKLGPFPQGPDRGHAARSKDSTGAEANDIGEAIGGRLRARWCIHIPNIRCQPDDDLCRCTTHKRLGLVRAPLFLKEKPEQ